MKGAVAAGNPLTAAAGAEVLDAGGNAVDAAVAAALASFVAEPLLSSAGGAGMMTLALADAPPVVVDFFSHAPLAQQDAAALDFEAFEVAFDNTSQVFHVGRGSAAAPMALPGLAVAAKRFGTLPLRELVLPAVRLARNGAVMSDEMAMVAQILWGILSRDSAATTLYADAGGPPVRGSVHQNRELADLLEEFAAYGGSPPRLREAILDAFGPHAGGRITLADLDTEPSVRAPRTFEVGDASVHTSAREGGRLIQIITERLGEDEPRDDEALEARRVAEACRTGHRARGAEALGSTTHISVIDGQGNVATTTLTNGEGSGHVVPGTGIQLNNFLGEEDLNPRGFHLHPPGAPLPSMIAPTIVRHGRQSIALGSGGSNRIRSVVSQVLYRLVALGEPLEAAVLAPRVHAEESHVWVELAERRAPVSVVAELQRSFAHVQSFPLRSFYFGGVHTVTLNDAGLAACGDPRRGGAAAHAR